MINKKSFFDKKKKIITFVGIISIIALSSSLLTNGSVIENEKVLTNNDVVAEDNKNQTDTNTDNPSTSPTSTTQETPDTNKENDSTTTEETSQPSESKEITPEEGLALIKAAGYTDDFLYCANVLGENGITYYEYMYDRSSDNVPSIEGDSRLIVDTTSGEVARHYSSGTITTHYYEDINFITTTAKYTPIEIDAAKQQAINDKIAERAAYYEQQRLDEIESIKKARKSMEGVDLLWGNWKVTSYNYSSLYKYSSYYITKDTSNSEYVGYLSEYYEDNTSYMMNIFSVELGTWIPNDSSTQIKVTGHFFRPSEVVEYIFCISEDKENVTIFRLNQLTNVYEELATAIFNLN